MKWTREERECTRKGSIDSTFIGLKVEARKVEKGKGKG